MKIKKFVKWFISPTKKPITQSEWSITCRMAELEEKYRCLLIDVKRLEEENIETANCIYELMENIRALDARIDILTAENWMSKDVR
jgi:hypothetical protein